ncbi:MAG: YhfC family glutamic-type intramembrane protease [Chloroflexota bacterium]
MTLLTVTYSLNALLMMALGVGLGAWLIHRFGLSWRLYGIGALTFVLSQVGHIPFNALILPWLFQIGMPRPPVAAGILGVAIFAGLSSGLWEETARWVMYRWGVKEARSWREALVLGAGHGGIEAVIFGALAAWTFIQALALSGVADLSTVVPAERLPEIQTFMEAVWSASWPASLLGALERLLALPLHLALSVLVLQVFRRRQMRWWLFAVLWHAAANGVTYGFLQWSQSAYLTELVFSLFTLGSCVIIWLLRDRQVPGVSAAAPEAQPVLPVAIRPAAETNEDLEKTRYQ